MHTNPEHFVLQAYVEHYLINDPKHLYVEGLINEKVLSMAVKFKYRLNESKTETAFLNENWDLVLAAVAKAAFETGKAGIGIGKGIFKGLTPIAKKLGSIGKEVTVDAAKWVSSQPVQVFTMMKSFTKNIIKGSKEAIKTLLGRAKEGWDFKKMAKNEPEAFLLAYKESEARMKEMGISTNPDEAAASIAIFNTEDGAEALKHGAEQSGLSPEEFKKTITTFVGQSKYVNLAVRKQNDPRKDKK